MAYNGGSVGGIVFLAAVGRGNRLAGICRCDNRNRADGSADRLGDLGDIVCSQSRARWDCEPDGDAKGVAAVSVTSPYARPLPGALLWHDWTFRTLAAGMALGLFAQLGLVTHLFSLLLPTLGAQRAGFAMALVTVMAIGGRTLLGWLMPIGADRRLVACLGYGTQLAGSLVFLAAGRYGRRAAPGRASSSSAQDSATLPRLPPLIAQVEFVKDEVLRVVALIVAMSQAAVRVLARRLRAHP